MSHGSPGAPVTAAPRAVAGHRVGRYEIVDELGRGGMAVVYLARQLDLDRFVALKELSELRAADAEFVNRFLREGRLASRLTHPSIVTVYDAFEYDGLPYLAMEYLPCGSLRGLMGGLTFAQMAGVLEAVLAGLAHAEAAGVVHRDLKPENVLVSAEGRAKIADFGIAKATGPVATTFRTATGMTVGTPTYMAPEQAQAQPLGPWTDLYSLGVIAYELFTGRVPFDGERSAVGVMLAHVSEPPAPLDDLLPGVPAAVAPWVMRLLAKDPEDRFRSAVTTWDALEDIILAELGPRWRRAARLPVHAGEDDGGGGALPLTPPAFERAPRDGDDSYETFDWPRPPAPSHETSAEEPPAPPTAPPAPPTPPPEPAVATVPPHRMPEPPLASPRRRRRRPLLIAGALGLAAVAAVAVLLLTGAEKPVPRQRAVAPPLALAGAGVRVEVPPGWRKLATPPTLPLLSVRRAVAAAPQGRTARGTIVVGLAPPSAANWALLSPPVLSALGYRGESAVPPREALTTASGVRLWFYGRLPATARSLAIAVLPTRAGVVTVACVGPDSGGPTADCRRVARSLRLAGAKPFPIGSSHRYGRLVRRVLGQAIDARRDLRAAQTAAAQASAARALATRYQRAGRLLNAAAVSPADRALSSRLARAVTAAGSAYLRLAAAAGRYATTEYARAGEQAQAAERRVAGAVTALRTVGYAVVPRFTAVRAPALRPRPRPRVAAPTPTPAASATPIPTPAPPTPPPVAPKPTPKPTPIPVG